MVEVFGSRETHPDIASTGIMAATGEDISHAGLIVDRTTIWHATGKGFHSVRLEDFARDHVLVYRFEVKVLDRSYAMGWLQGSHGKQYGASQYPGFLAAGLRQIGDNDDRQLICSEAVLLFGIDCCGLTFPADADFATPLQAIKAMQTVRV
jgi:hypothetical protein